MAIYNYKVLRFESKTGDSALLELVGEFTGKDPGTAATAAAAKVGKPGAYYAVPDRHFNHVPVVPTMSFAIGDSGQDPIDADPEADPEEGEGLAEGLDPDHFCETEDCGHLPAEHGAEGLGICRVEGCPCGKYEGPGA